MDTNHIVSKGQKLLVLFEIIIQFLRNLFKILKHDVNIFKQSFHIFSARDIQQFLERKSGS